MILNPNCSEQVFRLDGSLKSIKTEVMNMLNVINEERKVDITTKQDKVWYEGFKKQWDNKVKEVEAVKKIDDFKRIVFPFTCNYDTFFKPEDDGSLTVATCNNTNWDNVNYTNCDPDSYYSVANYNYFKVIATHNDWIVAVVAEREYKVILQTTDGREITKEDCSFEDRSVKLISSGFGNYDLIGRGKIRMKPVKDPKKLEEIREQMLIKDI